MPEAGQDVSLISVAALVCACLAVAYVTMQTLEDAAMSLVVGGLLFVLLVSLCRSPQSDPARRSRHRAGRWGR